MSDNSSETTHRVEVLYVEDEPVNVLLMRALFERLPYLDLRVAVDLRSALSLAPSIRPAVLLLDLRLPDGHGADLLGQLRTFAHLAHVPAIAVTADSLFDARQAGFDDMWHKPIDLRLMRDRLTHWLVTDCAARCTGAGQPAGPTLGSAPGCVAGPCGTLSAGGAQ